MIIMPAKIKILIIILAVGIVLAGGWWIWSFFALKGYFCNTDSDCAVKSIWWTHPSGHAFLCLNKNQPHSYTSFLLKVGLLKPPQETSIYRIEGEKCKCIGNRCQGISCERQGLKLGVVDGKPACVKKEKQVTIATDKTEYEQGEMVNIAVRNGLDKSIWYIKVTCPPSCCSLYRWENNEWKNLGDPMPCIQLAPPPGRNATIEANELKPRETISKQWNTIEYGEVTKSGKYRFSFYYGLSKDTYTEKTVYSPEFTIKEKSDVTITTDKTEYEQGEIVKITITNNASNTITNYFRFDRPSFYPLSVEQLKDGKYVKIGFLIGSLEDRQRIICVEKPKYAGFYMDLAPLQSTIFNWDQTKCMNEDATKYCEKVFPCKYRTSFTFLIEGAQKKVYSNEFTITEKKAKELTITTDKTEYEQEETVKITVFNGLMEDIFVIDSGYPYSARLERRNKSGEWEKVELLVIATKLMSKLLKPGEKHIYSWNQRIGNSSIAEPGIYRLGIYVYDGKEELYYSNEFTIKEK